VKLLPAQSRAGGPTRCVNTGPAFDHSSAETPPWPTPYLYEESQFCTTAAPALHKDSQDWYDAGNEPIGQEIVYRCTHCYQWRPMRAMFHRGWRADPDPGVEYWVEPDNQPPPTSAIVLQPNNEQPWVVARHDTWGEIVKRCLLKTLGNFRREHWYPLFWMAVKGEEMMDARNLTGVRVIAWVRRGEGGKSCRWHGFEITSFRAGDRRIKFLANHDVLTGLPNRARLIC
jgi:hypothetical protein